jgi:hypothetical protein
MSAHESASSSLAAALSRLRAAALEARRYVRSDPRGTDERILYICNALWHAGPGNTVASAHERRWLGKLRENLSLGLRYVQFDPRVLESYLYAAAFELGVLVRRLEKGGESRA